MGQARAPLPTWRHIGPVTPSHITLRRPSRGKLYGVTQMSHRLGRSQSHTVSVGMTYEGVASTGLALLPSRLKSLLPFSFFLISFLLPSPLFTNGSIGDLKFSLQIYALGARNRLHELVS
jgi:hypothetical protein